MNTTIKSTFFISISIFLTKILGLLRETLLSRAFGGLIMNNPLDAYYAAFKIPDMIYNFIAVGAGAAILVPILTEVLYKKDKNEYYKILSSFINFFLIICLFLIIIVFIFFPNIIYTFFPNFSLENQILTFSIGRLMLITPMFFIISSILGSHLSVFQKFHAYILSPLFYNLSIVLGIIFLLPYFGIYGVVYGVIFGAFLHSLVLIYPSFKTGFTYKLNLQFNKYIKEGIILAIPRIISAGISQMQLFIDTLISGMLVSGSLTLYNWSYNIFYLPIGIIGLPLSITTFPLLSKLKVEKNNEQFQKIFYMILYNLLFLSLYITIFFVLFNKEIVNLILNYGKFYADPLNLQLVTKTIFIFFLSIPAQVLIPFLNKTFYSFKNTKTPVIITSICILFHIIFSFLFAFYFNFGIVGLAISFAIISNITFFILIYFLNKLYIKNKNLLSDIIKFIFKLFVILIIIFGLMSILNIIYNTYFDILRSNFVYDKILDFIKLAFFGVVSLTLYIFLSYKFNIESSKFIVKNIFKKRG